MSRIYLHDEIKDILVENGNQWMTSKEIARLVNERGRYKKTTRAKTPVVEKDQISARTSNHLDIFKKDSGRIKLR